MSNHISSRILLDSLNPGIGGQQDSRLTTFEIKFPRVILAEVNTHRALSKNTASSRAIPFTKFLENVGNETYIPKNVGKNCKGMQSIEPLTPEQQQEFDEWCSNLFTVVSLECQSIQESLGIHKQFINRYLEPWMYVTMIISGTEWANFFALRTHKDAHPDFQILAKMMFEQYNESVPQQRTIHAPLVTEDEYEEIRNLKVDYNDFYDRLALISAGRCARVSYLTHDGVRDFSKDIELALRLSANNPKHMTPFEHVAFTNFQTDVWSGNFRGWNQYRKLIENENITEFSGWDEG